MNGFEYGEVDEQDAPNFKPRSTSVDNEPAELKATSFMIHLGTRPPGLSNGLAWSLCLFHKWRSNGAFGLAWTGSYHRNFERPQEQEGGV